VTVDALALAAALAQPWCDVVLSGAVTVDQLTDNHRALAVRDVLDAQALGAALGMRQDPQAYWAGRSRLPWQ
jgi:aryl-alcohol dehydrogenase-like predicted oxidoreductase